MRAVSSVVGAAIAIIFIVGVLFAFMNYYSEVSRIEYMRLRASREHLVIRPYLNGSGVYVSILNNGPVDPVTVRYVIVKNISSGRIVFVRELWRTLNVGEAVNLEIFNTTVIAGKFDIMAVTGNGAVIHLDPEYTGGDGLLDQGDIDRILSNATAGEYYINPLVGWAFDKSMVLQVGSGDVYYLILYSLGKPWNRFVEAVGYNKTIIPSTSSLIVYFKDSSGAEVKGIKAVSIDDGPPWHCPPRSPTAFYLVYRNGSMKYIDTHQYSDTDNFTRYDITLTAYVSEEIEFVFDNITIRFSRELEATIPYIELSFSKCNYFDRCAKVRYPKTVVRRWRINITVDYDSFLKYRVEAWDGNRWYLYSSYGNIVGNSAFKLYEREETSSTTVFESKVLVCEGSTVFFDIGSLSIGWSLRLSRFVYLTNVSRSYMDSVSIPYTSYDVYQPDMSLRLVSAFVRPSDKSTVYGYDDYLLPGNNVLRVNITMPEVYDFIIRQPEDDLPSYRVIISWLDPRLILDVNTSLPELLVRHGMFYPGDTVMFKVPCIVIIGSGPDAQVFVKYPGDTMVLGNGLYNLIPMSGQYKGNIFYLWVNEWRVVNGG